MARLLRVVHQRLVRSGRSRKTREQHTQRVSPGVEVQLLEERLDRFLGRLVGGERRPVVQSRERSAICGRLPWPPQVSYQFPERWFRGVASSATICDDRSTDDEAQGFCVIPR